MSSGNLRDTFAILGGLGLAALLAAVVALAGKNSVLAPHLPAARKARSATVAVDRSRLPAPEARGEEVVSAPAGERGVPQDVLRTATVAAAPWAPGLRLKRTTLVSTWEGRRAEIEDRTTGDVRAYAIGDLLPHGSLLVGISTGAADIMVADTHLVRLHEGGRVQPLNDLSKVEVNALKPARDLDPDYEDKIRVALVDLRSADPAVVQGAIDELVAAGDPAVELLVPQVDSMVPVRAAEYAFPSGSDVQARPKRVGVVVMLVLEKITGQTFGDLTREELGDAQIRSIASSWQRWWGR